MAMVIDCDSAHKIKSTDPDGAPVLERLLSSRLTVVIGGKLTEELRATRFFGLLPQLKLAGCVIEVDANKIDEVCATIKGGISSNDDHVIAIAIVSGCRVLFSSDRLLHDDFTNVDLVPRPKGKIYQRWPDHRRLLEDACR